MDIDKVLKSLARPYDEDMQVKAMVARCFIRDGSDLLEIFLRGWNSEHNNRSYRSKLFVKLRMAMECYLKGLVITFSDKSESPENAYKTARTSSHKLAELLAEVQKRTKGKKPYLKKASNALIVEVDKMKVGLRYELDMAAEYSKETPLQEMLETGPMSGTIGSDEWMLSLFEHTVYLEEKARKAFRQRLNAHSSYLGSDAGKRYQRIKTFMKNVKLV